MTNGIKRIAPADKQESGVRMCREMIQEGRGHMKKSRAG